MKYIKILLIMVLALVLSGCVKPVGENFAFFDDSWAHLQSGCEKNADPVFLHHITDVKKLKKVVPPGTLENDKEQGDIMKTHSWVQIYGKAPVYAPADAVMYDGVFYLEEGMGQYSLRFQTTCEVMYLFDHIQEPVQKVVAVFPDKPQDNTEHFGQIDPVEFKAGELIGYTTGTKFAHHFDFGVYNNSRENFLAKNAPANLTLFERDFLAECPYDYFPEAMRKVYANLFGTFVDYQGIPKQFCE